MKRDTVKTLAGLLVIAVIVVATFVYGNSQRQAQLKHDQEVKNQEVASGNKTPMASSSPQATTSTTPAKSPAANTAPVSSPRANSLQGGSIASPSTSPKSSKSPSPSSTPSSSASPAQSGAVASASEPKTGGSDDPLPQTGPSMGDLTGVAAIIFAVVWLRYSKRAVIMASRNRR